MRNILFLTIIFFSNSLAAQIFIPHEEVNWKNFEKNYSKEYKINELIKIDHFLINDLIEFGNLEKNLNNFHFLDYNSNGFIDIIFSGSIPGVEGLHTYIFELINGNYLATLKVQGEVISIHSLSGNKPPFSFVLHYLPCCGDYVMVYQIYHPVFKGENFKLEPSAKFITLDEVEFPVSFFDKPVLFEVNNDPYHLRSNPEIDNESEDIHPSIVGNIIGSYPKGSRGYAYAEKKDKTGRIWWFVAMVNNIEPIGTVLNRQFPDNNTKYHSVGWMSSRFLKVVD